VTYYVDHLELAEATYKWHKDNNATIKDALRFFLYNQPHGRDPAVRSAVGKALRLGTWRNRDKSESPTEICNDLMDVRIEELVSHPDYQHLNSLPED